MATPVENLYGCLIECQTPGHRPEWRPHRCESRLLHCLPIKFDPDAKCPVYDQALLEIFGEAHNPEDMVRHLHEFAGYAIQPLRDIPSYWVLIGHGNNDKSKLLATQSMPVYAMHPDGKHAF